MDSQAGNNSNTDYNAIRDYCDYTSRLFDSLQGSLTDRGNILLIANSIILGGSFLVLTTRGQLPWHGLLLFAFTIGFSLLSIGFSIGIVRPYKSSKSIDMTELMHFRVVNEMSQEDLRREIVNLDKTKAVDLFLKRIKSTSDYLVKRYSYLYRSFWLFIVTMILFVTCMGITITEGGAETMLHKTGVRGGDRSNKGKTELLFIGTGSPLSTSYNTSILIEDSILLDAPPGIDKKLIDNGKSLGNVDYVFISHLHGDHILGLPQFLLNMRALKRTKPLYIVGPEGTEKTINTILELTFGGEGNDIVDKSKAVFVVISREHEEMQLGNLLFEAYELSHGEETDYGYLIYRDDKIIGYTGDTGPCDNLDILINKSHIVILDMTLDKTTPGHLGIDFVEKIPMVHDNKTLFAIHRGKEIDDVSTEIEGVLFPVDGELYEV